MLQFENKQIDSQHPFFQSAQLLQARWAVPQRQTQYAQTVTMNDLGEVFLGKHGSNQTRTDFSSYRKGDNARPKQTLLDAVHLVLPALKVFYELGPAGLPLWSAFAGKNSADDFWHHLKISKNFDLKRWSNLLTLMKDGFRNSATNQTIESTPWWIWGQSLKKFLDTAPATLTLPDTKPLALITIAIIMARESEKDPSTKFVDQRQMIMDFLVASTATVTQIDAEIFGAESIQSENFNAENWTLTRVLNNLIDGLRVRVDEDLQSLA